MELAKPWSDLNGYIEARRKETLFEAELAREFLRQGLTRNAAGKAYQAWKATIAVLAAKKLGYLSSVYRWVKRIKNKRVGMAEWLVAYMPSTRLREVARLLAEAYGIEVFLATELALSLHEYQFNGPDKELVLSRYKSDDEAARDVELLLKYVEVFLGA